MIDLYKMEEPINVCVIPHHTIVSSPTTVLTSIPADIVDL